MKIKHEYVNDDWARLYIDGKIVYENHICYAQNLMQALEEIDGFECEYTEVQEDD